MKQDVLQSYFRALEAAAASSEIGDRKYHLLHQNPKVLSFHDLEAPSPVPESESASFQNLSLITVFELMALPVLYFSNYGGIVGAPSAISRTL